MTRVFAVVLFASFAHLALALALLGIAAGSLAQHLYPWLVPAEALEERLGWLDLGLAGSSVVAVIAAITLPITVQFAEPPVTYGERSSVHGDLVDPLWFTVLLGFLVLPFALGGLVFAGAFHRRKEAIGELYAADLVGGAVGALTFVPLLYAVSGPDAVFAVALAALVPAAMLFHAAGARTGRSVALLALAGALTALFAATLQEVLPVRYAAGYSEQNVTWVRWTPLTRLAIHEDARGTYMLLDNTSASEIVTTPERQRSRAREPNRSAVYRLHQPPGRVAILAASAGPEVAVAQGFGFTDIDAIDIAPEIGDAVAARFADAPFNPFRAPGVRRVLLDGRAAILHGQEPWDVIQMVHANLHSSAGLLASAWSPALLETRQAFDTYFDHLTDDGTLSFARGTPTHEVGRAIVASLRRRGVAEPERHVMLIRGNASVVLAKKRPFTVGERNRIRKWLRSLDNQYLGHDPVEGGSEWGRMARGPVLTDAHPYFETPDSVLRSLVAGLLSIGGTDGQVPPSIVLYRTLALQGVFVAAAGMLLLGLPMARRGTDAPGLQTWPLLLYVASIGYAYLAVETVLIHELVLFVGHPTYAITVVILAMLLASGVASAWAQRVPEGRLLPTLRGGLAAALALGALQAWAVPELLHALALGLPLGARSALTFAALVPLGFAMGLPFPLGMRLLRDEASALVPWAWAVNGWMSVVATLGTVLIARALSYPAAFTIALSAYVVALACAGRISGVRG